MARHGRPPASHPARAQSAAMVPKVLLHTKGPHHNPTLINLINLANVPKQTTTIAPTIAQFSLPSIPPLRTPKRHRSTGRRPSTVDQSRRYLAAPLRHEYLTPTKQNLCFGCGEMPKWADCPCSLFLMLLRRSPQLVVTANIYSKTPPY